MARILILEDDYELASSWRDAFESRKHEVDLALSSSEAIAYTTEATYDLFVVDLYIPSFPGYHDSGRIFLQELKNSLSPNEIATKCIGTSGLRIGKTTDAAQLLFSSYGVTNFLEKPFTPEKLVKTAEELLPEIDHATSSILDAVQQSQAKNN